MAKIFVLSPNRSATTSTQLFLEAHGLSCIHWLGDGAQREVEGRELDLDHVADVADARIRTFDAAADLPIPAIYRQLDRRYPEARFVLVTRPPEDWAASVLRRYTEKGKRDIAPFARCLYWQYLPHRPVRTADITAAHLQHVYAAHFEAVARYFSGTGRFAAFDLGDPRLAGRLGEFLGFTAVKPFPHANAGAENAATA